MPNLYNLNPIYLGRALGASDNILFMTEGARSAILHITATSSGAGIWEGTMENVGSLGEDGVDWYPLPSATINTTTTRNAPGATVTPTDDDVLVADNLGAKYARYRRTAGTATGNVALSELTLDQVIASSGGSLVVTMTQPDAIIGPGDPVIDSYTSVAISASAGTANQSLITAPGSNKQIWVYGLVGTADTADGSISFQDEDDTALTGVMEVSRRGGIAIPPSGNFAQPLFKVATNKALEIDTVGCGFKGVLTRAIVSV